MKSLLLLLVLLFHGCSYVTNCFCMVSPADAVLLSRLTQMNWDEVNAITAEDLLQSRLSSDGAADSCNESAILRSSDSCGICNATLMFDREKNPSGQCHEHLRSLTLVRQITDPTTPSTLAAVLASTRDNATPPAITMHGFTQVIEIDTITAYTLRADIEKSERVPLARVLLYRTP